MYARLDIHKNSHFDLSKTKARCTYVLYCSLETFSSKSFIENNRMG